MMNLGQTNDPVFIAYQRRQLWQFGVVVLVAGTFGYAIGANKGALIGASIPPGILLLLGLASGDTLKKSFTNMLP